MPGAIGADRRFKEPGQKAGQSETLLDVEARSPSHLDIDGVYKVFLSAGDPVTALANCSLSARPGEFISLVGPSGCGKSTLLQMVAGLASVTRGRISVGGAEVAGPLRDAGIAFQDAVLLPWRSALANVMLQLESRGLRDSDGQRQAAALLDTVGLSGFHDHLPHQLSGGMQQRVALCRALVHEPALLLMDEPFAALDALTRDQLTIDLQALWLRRRPTVLFVTHSLDEAVFLSDRVYVMTPRPGKIEQVFVIDLPRPRRLAIRDDPAFAAYTAAIRTLFLRRGILREDG